MLAKMISMVALVLPFAGQPAHAEFMPTAKLRDRRGGVRYRDAAQAPRIACERVEHRPVVAAMRAALHQRATAEAQGVEHG